MREASEEASEPSAWPHLDLPKYHTLTGTYIKEFVHGDFGRTLPNLGSLLHCEADILSLDVLVRNLDQLISDTSPRLTLSTFFAFATQGRESRLAANGPGEIVKDPRARWPTRVRSSF